MAGLLGRSPTKGKTSIVVAAIIAVLCILPFVLRTYHLEIMTILLIDTILAVSFAMIAITGEFSLAHRVMMGVGAYTSAILTTDLGFPFWAALPLGGIIAALIGRGISYPLVRMTGFAFFIGSYAAGEAIRLCWVRFRFPFGGVRGMINLPSPSIGSFDFGGYVPYYFMTMGIMLVCLFVMYRIYYSRIGDTFKAIHSDPSVAESTGIDIVRYRNLAFVIGCFFAGIAGVLLAHKTGAIDPYNFALTDMLYLLVWVVVGGINTFWGPIIGTGVMTAVYEGSRFLAEWRPLLFGFILILSLIFNPRGIDGLFPRIKAFFQRMRGEEKQG